MVEAAEKNELKSNSIESAMYVTVTELIDEVQKSEENNESGIYEFTNEQIWNKFKKVIIGMDIRAELLYSMDEGRISQKRLTSLCSLIELARVNALLCVLPPTMFVLMA